MRRMARWLAGWATAMITGGLYVLALAAMMPEFDPRRAVEPLLVGAFYGLAVLALLRVLRARSWGLPVAGLLAGPVPVILLLAAQVPAEERPGLVLLGCLGGVLIGLLDWSRTAAGRAEGRSGETSGRS